MANLLFHALVGSENPTRACFPFLQAVPYKERGDEVQIALGGAAVVLTRDSVINSVIPVGWPPLKETFERVGGAPCVRNCERSVLLRFIHHGLPICLCFDVRDRIQPDLREGERYRSWDSCMFDGVSDREIKRSELLQLMARNQAFLLLDEPESGVNLENSPKKSLKKVIGYLTILKRDQAHTDSFGTFTAVPAGVVYETVPYGSRYSVFSE